MNKIIKFFGLPRTGTNLLEKLLVLNLNEEVSQTASYHPNYHYLGWKHGLPKSIQTYEILEKHKNEKYYFIFLNRELKSWKEAVLTRHTNTWEFPKYYANIKDIFVYNTPQGPEIYKDIEELYHYYNNVYYKFNQINPDRSMIINHENLVKDQKQTLINIKNKFNFEFSHDTIYEVKKKIDSGGRIKKYDE